MAEVVVFVESNTTGTGRLFVERAREMGLVPVLLTADATRYPYVAELDVTARTCDTASPSAVSACCRRLAGEHHLTGITSSSEFYVVTAARVARVLGLPGEDPRRLAAARNKALQRRSFAASGVPSPRFGTAWSTVDAVRAADRLGLPVVVKPISRSGSIGVRRCDTAAQVAQHSAELLATTVDERGNPLPDMVLVESYLDGPEFSVELVGGAVRALVAKHLDVSRGFLEVGHDVPAPVDARTGACLARTARAALAALGLHWGAAHVELRLVADRAYVVEVNARLAGGMIPHAIRFATGDDLIGELLARAVGMPAPRRARRPTRCTSIRFLVPAGDGEVRSVPTAAVALAMPGVVDAAVTARPRQRITRGGTFLDRLGHVIATGDTHRQAAARAERAVAALAVELEGSRG